jgi:hypothetical protein
MELSNSWGKPMHRRTFLAAIFSTLVFLPTSAHAANRKFVFKIKTKSGSIVSNIVIEAKDMEAAKVKLRKRYPDCEILEAKEK